MTYCGKVSIIGKSNVGKSSLINRLIGKKISIISSKKQTTRNNIIGIYTDNLYQIIYIDTPGINIFKKNIINKIMNKIIYKSIYNVELIIFMLDRNIWNYEDDIIVNMLNNIKSPIIGLINKIDKLSNKINLLPYIKYINKKIKFNNIIPISIKKNINIELLVSNIKKKIPKNKYFYSKKKITICSNNFLISEIIREKLMYFLKNELPYTTTVYITNNFINNNKYYIYANILVSTKNHKKIIIGKNGNLIKKIGIKSRLDIEKLLKFPVYLNLLIKIKYKWYDNNTILKNLCYINSL